MTNQEHNRELQNKIADIGNVTSQRHLAWILEQIRLCNEEEEKLTLEKDLLYTEADSIVTNIYANGGRYI